MENKNKEYGMSVRYMSDFRLCRLNNITEGCSKWLGKKDEMTIE